MCVLVILSGVVLSVYVSGAAPLTWTASAKPCAPPTWCHLLGSAMCACQPTAGRDFALGAFTLHSDRAGRELRPHNMACVAQARLDTWKGMSPKARQQFLWPKPGLPRGEDKTPYEQVPVVPMSLRY